MNQIKPETHPDSSLIDTDVNLEKSKSLDLGLEQIKSKPFKIKSLIKETLYNSLPKNPFLNVIRSLIFKNYPYD